MAQLVERCTMYYQSKGHGFKSHSTPCWRNTYLRLSILKTFGFYIAHIPIKIGEWGARTNPTDYVDTNPFPAHKHTGHNIKGLECQYRVSLPSLEVYLQAVRCWDLFYPNPANPVATSCGVVALYHDISARWVHHLSNLLPWMFAFHGPGVVHFWSSLINMYVHVCAGFLPAS